jgi:uncharacterized membrane protein YdbT with pleckstrin-like domain
VDLLEGEQLIWKGKPTWRATLSFYIGWGLAALVPFVVILLVNIFTSTDWPIWLGVVISGILLAIVLLAGWIRRFFTQYTVTTKRMTIREGILAKRESTAHVDRIQNITITQSPIDRIMKVGTVDFDTAGEETRAQLRFFGVDDPQDLRDRVARANEARDDSDDRQGGLAS